MIKFLDLKDLMASTCCTLHVQHLVFCIAQQKFSRFHQVYVLVSAAVLATAAPAAAELAAVALADPPR
jgi:hypothetical protein